VALTASYALLQERVPGVYQPVSYFADQARIETINLITGEKTNVVGIKSTNFLLLATRLQTLSRACKPTH
jgi:hypothetical protein